MERRRQAIFYFIAAGLFAIVSVTQARHHMFAGKAVIAALIAIALAVLGAKAQRDAGDES
jgi:hypothetical protein